MIVRKLRLQRGWSQEQLAELSGLSVRTVQRLESGNSAGLETYKSLASVFDINFTELQAQQEKVMNYEVNVSEEERRAIQHVKQLKEFYNHAVSFVVVITGLTLLNWLSGVDYWWVLWVILGWGIGLAAHAAEVFEMMPFLNADWEKKQIEKRLGRRL